MSTLFTWGFTHRESFFLLILHYVRFFYCRWSKEKLLRSLSVNTMSAAAAAATTIRNCPIRRANCLKSEWQCGYWSRQRRLRRHRRCSYDALFDWFSVGLSYCVLKQLVEYLGWWVSKSLWKNFTCLLKSLNELKL